VVVTSELGFARVSEVYGEGLAEVYAFGAGYTIGHARVPVRADASSAVIIHLARSYTSEPVPDIAAAGEAQVHEPPMLPPPEMPDAAIEMPATLLTLSFEAASFETAWGEPAKGLAIVRGALLHALEDAAAAPGALIAFVDDARVPLAAHLTFEVPALQGATDLAPVKPLTVRFAWPEGRVPAEDAELAVFRFDPERGAFVAEGTLTRTAEGAELSVEKLGHFAIGTLATTTRCVQVEVRGSGGPLADAGVLARGATGFSLARATSGAGGSTCVALPAESEAVVLGALANTSDGLVQALGAEEALAAPAMLGAACDATACPRVELVTETPNVTCVRGELSAPRDVSWSVTWQHLGLSGGSPAALLNGPFCVASYADAMLTFSGYGPAGSCTVTRMAASSNRLCGDEGCTDLGTIECCVERELCDDLAVDDDCDGMVDEGCSCGGSTCPFTTLPNCCTAAGACGATSPYTDACIGNNYLATDTAACPSATVPFGNGDVYTAYGCCSVATMECGLRSPDADFGCVVPADATALWGPTVVLSSMACTP
jgi:hypothetical protein